MADLLKMVPRLVVIDFETCASPTGQRPVEIAAIVLERGVETTRIVELVNPGVPIDPFTNDVHGIEDDDVANAPPFEEQWPRLAPLLEGSLAAAHHAPFDSGVLAREIQRLNLKPPAMAWWCTCRLARGLWPGKFTNYKLATLAAEMKLSGTNSHRAEDDAELALELLHRAFTEAPALGFSHPRALRKFAEHRGRTWPFKRCTAC